MGRGGGIGLGFPKGERGEGEEPPGVEKKEL